MKNLSIFTLSVIALASVQAQANDSSDVFYTTSVSKNVSVARAPWQGSKVSAQVYMGSNSCTAEGVEAQLVQRKEGDKIVVEALTRRPSNSRICTMIFRPVYKTISLVVKAPARKIIVKNVGDLGIDVGGANPQEQITSDAVLLNASSVAINPGIVNNSFGIAVFGEIPLGSNPCEAAGKTGELRTFKVSAVQIVVKPVVVGVSKNRICTREYNPVFANVRAEIRDNTAVQVTVENVEQEGSSMSAFELPQSN